jgi:hypothetical protein
MKNALKKAGCSSGTILLHIKKSIYTRFMHKNKNHALIIYKPIKT